MIGVFFLMTVLGSCQQNSEPTKSDGTIVAVQEQISVVLPVQEFRQKLEKSNVQLLDVRTPGELKGGYIAGAQNVDISKWATFEAAIANLNKNEPVLVYCAVGGRSRQAASYLEKQGFTEIYDLQGGIQSWMAASGEIVKQ